MGRLQMGFKAQARGASTCFTCKVGQEQGQLGRMHLNTVMVLQMPCDDVYIFRDAVDY